MGTSFQDQLLKSGLVNKKQVQKTKHEKRANRKKNKGESAPPEINKALQEKLAKEKQNKERNQQIKKEKQNRENLAQVRELIEKNRLNLDDTYDEPYHFVLGKKIKKLFVTEKIATQLSLGQLAIVQLDSCFEIVPARVAKQIDNRDPDTIVVLHKPEK